MGIEDLNLSDKDYLLLSDSMTMTILEAIKPSDNAFRVVFSPTTTSKSYVKVVANEYKKLLKDGLEEIRVAGDPDTSAMVDSIFDYLETKQTTDLVTKVSIDITSS